MFQAITVYLLLGCIVSVFMLITSKHPLPIGREIAAHTSIVIFWPLVLINIARIFRKEMKKNSAEDEDDIE